jgi:stearoyl-CoA desaturase (Delta-9 desaturase)
LLEHADTGNRHLTSARTPRNRAPACRVTDRSESNCAMTVDAQNQSDDIVYPSSINFLVVHMRCFAVFWTGFNWRAAALGLALYVLRIFAITAGYHRYFAHRAYSTSRAGQFILACLAQSSAQRGILWWAAHHRRTIGILTPLTTFIRP